MEKTTQMTSTEIIPMPEDPVRPPLRKMQSVAFDALSATTTIIPEGGSETTPFDIEHVPVTNDPRAWSTTRKNISLTLIASASMVAALASNIQNPAVNIMEADLPATASQFSLTVSLFILTQGLLPLVWSAISEVKGRRLVYILSLTIFMLGSIAVALSRNVASVIGFRCVEAAGSSAVIAIGAATLADIFEPAERGTKMGIYYIAPLLGPAMGPIFGGILTSVWNWRATFWFLTVLSATSVLCFILFFKDTFRPERSLTYQRVAKEKMRSTASLPLSCHSHRPPTPNVNSTLTLGVSADIERGATYVTREKESAAPAFKLSITDVNPFRPIGQVLKRPNNVLILFSSGFLYAFGFVVLFASSRTLADRYGYSPLMIGLIAIAYGAGSIAGSLLGGCWSDHAMKKMRVANDGSTYPEMRLKCTIWMGIFLPPSVIALGWVYHFHQHIAVVCVFLFLSGFFTIWIYCSSLAYLVDANNGRSSTAVSTNGAFRGLFAFIATEIAVPLQDGLGDGLMYLVWAAVVALGVLCIFVVSKKGQKWRLDAEMREAELSKVFEEASLPK